MENILYGEVDYFKGNWVAIIPIFIFLLSLSGWKFNKYGWNRYKIDIVSEALRVVLVVILSFLILWFSYIGLVMTEVPKEDYVLLFIGSYLVCLEAYVIYRTKLIYDMTKSVWFTIVWFVLINTIVALVLFILVSLLGGDDDDDFYD